MSFLSKYDHAVMEALQNEAMTLTAYERDQQFLHEVGAWNNAAIYAEQAGLDIVKFRKTITKLTGYKPQDNA